MKKQILTAMFTAVLLGCSDDEPLPVRGDFTTIDNLTYASYGDRELTLDLYLPDSPAANPTPVVVAVRGGGFRRGDKAAFGPIAGGLADRGIASASIEYRTSAEAKFPGCISDTKAAVRWLRANAQTYGLDPNAIGVLGGSAGGYLATYAGVTADIVELEGDGGNSGVSSRVQAIVALGPESGPSGLSAWTDFLDETNGRDEGKREFASALTHIDDGQEPPLLLIHSTTDSTVPFTESEKLLEAFETSANQARLLPLERAPHTFWYDTFWYTVAIDAAAEFFADELVSTTRTANNQ